MTIPSPNGLSLDNMRRDRRERRGDETSALSWSSEVADAANTGDNGPSCTVRRIADEWRSAG